jgi:hypothetical protein
MRYKAWRLNVGLVDSARTNNHSYSARNASKGEIKLAR